MKTCLEWGNKVFFAGMFSLWSSLLLVPWVEAFHLSFAEPGSAPSVWVPLTVFFSVMVGGFLEGKKGKGLVFLVPLVYVLLQGIVLVSFRLPLPFYGVVFFLLFGIGMKGASYEARGEFVADFSLSLLFLLFTLMSQPFTEITLGHGTIFLFIATGIGLVLHLNLLRMRKLGFPMEQKNLGGVFLGFFSGLAFFTLLLKGFFREKVLTVILTVVSFLYNLLVDLFFFLLVRPFLWLTRPLWNWVEEFEGEWQLPSLLSQEGLGEAERASLTVSAGEVPRIVPVLSWIFLYAFLALLLYLLLRKLLAKEPIGQGIYEERESLFSSEELVNELKDRMKKALKRTRSPLKDDAVARIREHYRVFLRRYHRRVPRSLSSTAKEYEGLLLRQTLLDERALMDFTDVYYKARYKEEASLEDEKRMQELLGRLRG